MRNLVYYVACSVDGFLAHEDCSTQMRLSPLDRKAYASGVVLQRFAVQR